MTQVAHKHIRIKEGAGSVVLSPKGNLTGGEETDELKRLLNEYLAQKAGCVVVDLKDTEFLTSMALGVLIAAHVSSTKAGQRLVLCSLDRRIWHVLVITRLALTFDVFENEAKALAGCTAERMSPPAP
jgi:anti-anti-sigma factor